MDNSSSTSKPNAKNLLLVAAVVVVIGAGIAIVGWLIYKSSTLSKKIDETSSNSEQSAITASSQNAPQSQSTPMETSPAMQAQPIVQPTVPVTQQPAPVIIPQPVVQPTAPTVQPQPIVQPTAPIMQPQPVVQPTIPTVQPQPIAQPIAPTTQPQPIVQPTAPVQQPTPVTQPQPPSSLQPVSPIVQPQPIVQPTVPVIQQPAPVTQPQPPSSVQPVSPVVQPQPPATVANQPTPLGTVPVRQLEPGQRTYPIRYLRLQRTDGTHNMIEIERMTLWKGGRTVAVTRQAISPVVEMKKLSASGQWLTRAGASPHAYIEFDFGMEHLADRVQLIQWQNISALNGLQTKGVTLYALDKNRHLVFAYEILKSYHFELNFASGSFTPTIRSGIPA